MIRCAATLVLILVAQSVYAEPNDIAGVKKPFLLQFTDDPARAMLLEPLRTSSIGEFQKEVRIWTGFGVALPGKMVRFRIGEGGSVQGDTFLYYPARLKNDKNLESSNFYLKMISECRLAGVHGSKEACKKMDSGDFQLLYEKLLTIGVWQLPDETDVPRIKGDVEVLDGIAVVVELRSGDDYRAYQWSNPSFKNSNEAQKASAIISMLHDF